MVEMVDLPNTTLHDKRRNRRIGAGLLTVVIVMLCAIAWGGERTIHIDTVAGLDVQAEFMGYRDVSPRGEYVYARGTTLAYRIIIKNRSNKTLGNVTVQSSLHSDGATCANLNLSSDALLPGNALSPVHSISVPPGETYDFEVGYSIPKDLCNSSGHLKVDVEYTIQKVRQAATLTSPAHFHFE